jgi:hypothetical protein
LTILYHEFDHTRRMVSQKVQYLCCTASFVIVAYQQVLIIAQDFRVLILALLAKPAWF